MHCKIQPTNPPWVDNVSMKMSGILVLSNKIAGCWKFELFAHDTESSAGLWHNKWVSLLQLVIISYRLSGSQEVWYLQSLKNGKCDRNFSLESLIKNAWKKSRKLLQNSNASKLPGLEAIVCIFIIS